MSEFPLSLREEVWTIVGARGWIGSQLCAYLRRAGATVAEFTHVDSAREAAGHLVWCSGVIYGAERSVRDTYRAHLTDVERWLDAPKLASFTYLSSTRVYDLVDRTSEDTLLLRSDSIYALTKGAGEALVLSRRPRARRARPRTSTERGSSHRCSSTTCCARRPASSTLSCGIARVLEDYVGLNDTVELPSHRDHRPGTHLQRCGRPQYDDREIVDGFARSSRASC